jgi:zinc and cadmium transporter
LNTLGWILLFTALSGAASALLAAVVLLLPAAQRTRWLPHMLSFATGTLLAASLLALIPHAIMSVGFFKVHEVGIALLAGILLFFLLEKFLLWRHCHSAEVETHAAHSHHREQASGALVLTGDAIHNTLDGVIIAAAFLTDFHLGVVTAVAIMAHEIPQEIGNFAVLLHSGMSRGRALAVNLATSATALVGGVAAYFALREVTPLLPYALAVAAASLLYVAVADLIPGLHRRTDLRGSLAQVAWIAIGIAVVAVAEQYAH